MIEIIPAIDIIDGRCVRLTKGDFAAKKVYDASPLEMAQLYADCGVTRIHMVDLDGARRSKPMNLATLEEVASKSGVEIEWGGGIAGRLPGVRLQCRRDPGHHRQRRRAASRRFLPLAPYLRLRPHAPRRGRP